MAPAADASKAKSKKSTKSKKAAPPAPPTSFKEIPKYEQGAIEFDIQYVQPLKEKPVERINELVEENPWHVSLPLTWYKVHPQDLWEDMTLYSHIKGTCSFLSPSSRAS